MSCDPGCECQGQTQGAVPAHELFHAEAARQQWADLEPHLGEPGADAAVAALFAEHGPHLTAAIRRSRFSTEDVADLRMVQKFRRWAEGQYPQAGTEALSRVSPDRELLAEITLSRTRVIEAGVALATGTDADMLELSATQAEHRTKIAAGIRVNHRMLSTPGVRHQLGVHGAQRHRFASADGRGHQQVSEDGGAETERLRDAKEKPATRLSRGRRRR